MTATKSENIVVNEAEFKLYKQRWGVLFAVAMMNISCGAIWINNFPVATTVASYYERDATDVNWFSNLFFLGSLPFTFVAAFVADKFGLKILLHVGSILNLLDAVIRAIATSGIFENKNTQFFIGIFGQCFGAVANSFFLGIAPKVSQKWFPDSERGMATTIGAMARPVGVIITQLTVPAIVRDKDDVPLNNYVWLGPCIVSQICTMLFITREDPKTPPSRSAKPRSVGASKSPIWEQMKSAFSSLAFILLFLAVGGGIAIVFTFGTLTQQILCPLGYSQAFAGIVSGLVLLGGFVGSACVTFYMKRNSNLIEITKLCMLLSLPFLIGQIEMFLVADKEVLMAFFATVFGFFGMGVLPAALELGVEVTYPAEETISGVFIYMSGQIQAMLFILLIPAIAKEIHEYTPFCDSSQPYDYTLPLMLVLTWLVLCCLALALFLKTKYKRREAEAALPPLPQT